MEHLENIKKKSIFLQIDKESNKLLFIYNELPSKFRKGNVIKCCNIELKTCYGYKWLYLEDYQELIYPKDKDKVIDFLKSLQTNNTEDSNITEFRANITLKNQIQDKQVNKLLYYVTTNLNLSEIFICNSVDMPYRDFKRKYNTDSFTVEDKIKISEFIQDYFIGANKIDIRELYKNGIE